MAADDNTGPRTDPDRGSARGDPPSVQTQLDRIELTVRAEKVKFMREQSELLNGMNELTAWPKAKRGEVES